jgi:hypothetical protein
VPVALVYSVHASQKAADRWTAFVALALSVGEAAVLLDYYKFLLASLVFRLALFFISHL